MPHVVAGYDRREAAGEDELTDESAKVEERMRASERERCIVSTIKLKGLRVGQP